MRIAACCLISMLDIDSALALDPNRTISQYVHERWGTEKGLPKGPIYAVSQTPDGYIWVGTERGLVRFDGRNFELIKSSEATSPTVTHVLGLTVDPEGSLWARLRRPTLLRFQDGAFDTNLDQLGDSGFTAAAIGRSFDGALLVWALKGEPRALRLRQGKFETLASPLNFSRSPVLAITQTEDGALWVGTRDAGLFRLIGNKTEAIRDGLPDPKVNSIASSGKNHLWIATDKGVVKWDGSKLTQAGIPKELLEVRALSITIDRDHNLWVGTSSHGLLRANPQGVSALTESTLEGSGAITAIFEDSSSSLWFASGSGLHRLRDSPFVSYSQSEGVPSEGTTPIYMDANQRLWFGPAKGGLAWIENARQGRLSVPGLDQEIVYSITADASGLWLGTKHRGLIRLPLTQGSHTETQGPIRDTVYAVQNGEPGTVWVGTLSHGLSSITNGRVTNYTAAEGFSSNTVNTIQTTSAGEVLVGTPAGLTIRSSGKWATLTTRDGLPSNEVNCTLVDSKGRIWAGTSAGLAFREGKRFQTGSSWPTVLREPVYGMAEDDLGFIWISTENHILRLPLEKALRNSIAEGDLREYGLGDGLRGTSGVKRHQSLLRDAKGRIWISLNHGISFVDPTRMRADAHPVSPKIQKLSIDGKDIPLSKSLLIPAGTKRIALTFAGLGDPVPERIRFRYRLDGFDSKWSEPTGGIEAVFTNLEPRDYRFRLVASGADGLWSKSESTIDFAVAPLFWQTTWFRAGLLILMLAAALALYRLRLNQLTVKLNMLFEERLDERIRIAQELHDTLLQGLLSSTIHLHIATDQVPLDSPAKKTLGRTLEIMDQVIVEGRNAVQGLRTFPSGSINLQQALARLPEELQPNSTAADSPKFRVLVYGEEEQLHPHIRDEVYRIGREAIVNAFRHAEANSIELEIAYSRNGLKVLLRDNGRSIPKDTLESGREGHWGLAGMRERARRINARLHLHSDPASGTQVELFVPAHLAFMKSRLPIFSRLAKWWQHFIPGKRRP